MKFSTQALIRHLETRTPIPAEWADDMAALTRLDLWGTKVVDVSPLAGNTNLRIYR